LFAGASLKKKIVHYAEMQYFIQNNFFLYSICQHCSI